MRLTSPRAHLDDLIQDGKDLAGWMVCRIFVRDIRRLGLEVIHKPTERDPGHCEIVGKSEQCGTMNYPNIKSSKLARETRILTDEEVAELKAGDLPTE